MVARRQARRTRPPADHRSQLEHGRQVQECPICMDNVVTHAFIPIAATSAATCCAILRRRATRKEGVPRVPAPVYDKFKVYYPNRE